MKKIFFVFLTTFTFLLPFSENSYSCQNLSDFLKLPQHPQHGINVSLAQMVSLEYVRHAFSKNYSPQSTVCSEVLVLSKNEYQYYRYLIKLTVNDPTSKEGQFNHFVYFQDASTQAFHNYFSKPWIGLNGEDVNFYLTHLDNNLTSQVQKLSKKRNQGYYQFNVTNQNDLLSQIKETSFFKSQKNLINHQTLSLLSLSDNSFLVTWMKKLSDSGNPFIDSEISEGFYVSYNSVQKLFEGVPFRPAFHRIPLNKEESLTLFEALEQNLGDSQKSSLLSPRDLYLFNLRVSL